MTSVTTTRLIDPGQLSSELGGVSLRLADDGVTRTVTADVLNAELQAAVDAHIPKPPPPSPVAVVQSQIDAIVDLLLEIL